MSRLNERIMYVTRGSSTGALCLRIEGYPTAEYPYRSLGEAITKYSRDNGLAKEHISVIDLRWML